MVASRLFIIFRSSLIASSSSVFWGVVCAWRNNSSSSVPQGRLQEEHRIGFWTADARAIQTRSSTSQGHSPKTRRNQKRIYNKCTETQKLCYFVSIARAAKVKDVLYGRDREKGLFGIEEVNLKTNDSQWKPWQTSGALSRPVLSKSYFSTKFQ